jgi:tripartite-type tricarboxylate transporter receptor subunit TctC
MAHAPAKKSGGRPPQRRPLRLGQLYIDRLIFDVDLLDGLPQPNSQGCTVPLDLAKGAAGRTTDITARLIGQWLSDRLGQQFIIENRPGAGSNIAAEAVVRAPADGYTLMMFDGSPAINATLYEKLNFNFIRDITPIASIHRVPFVMEVNPSLPVGTVPEFIAYAKSNPGKM